MRTWLRALAPVALTAAGLAAVWAWSPAQARRPVPPRVVKSVSFAMIAPDLDSSSPDPSLYDPQWMLYSHSPSPAWSPDGKRVAFHDGVCVSVFKATGKRERLLRRPASADWYEGVDACRSPRWSPSGRSIVTSHSFHGMADRWTAGRHTTVSAFGQGLWSVGFGADEGWIVGRIHQTGAVVLRPDDPMSARALVSDVAPVLAGYFPTLSPDGRHAARVLNDREEIGLEILRVDVDAPPTLSVENRWSWQEPSAYPAVVGQRVALLPGPVPEYAWSADGTRLVAVTQASWYSGYDSYGYDAGPLVYVDLRSGQVRDLGVTGTNPTLSPDGLWVAYNARAEAGIWIVPTTGGGGTRIAASGMEPQWSPDGRHLLVLNPERGEATIHTLK